MRLFTTFIRQAKIALHELGCCFSAFIDGSRFITYERDGVEITGYYNCEEQKKMEDADWREV